MNWVKNVFSNYNIALSFVVLLVACMTVYMLIRCIKRPKFFAIIAFGFQLFVLTFGIMSILNKVVTIPLYEILIIGFGVLVPFIFLFYDYFSMKKKIIKYSTNIPLIENLEKPSNVGWQYEDYVGRVDEWQGEIKLNVVINSLVLDDKSIKNNIIQQLSAVHKLIDNSEYKQALDIYIILSDLLSKNINIIYNTAWLYYRNELFEEAIQCYKRALSLIGNDSKSKGSKHKDTKETERIKALLRFGYGCSLYRLNRYVSAISQFTSAKKEKGELKVADVNIAKCYIAVGELGEAQKHIREALKVEGDNRLRYILARLCFERNEEMECKHQLETIVESDSEFTEAWTLLGDLYRKRSDWASVLRVYKKLTVLTPDNPEVYYYLGVAQRHEGKTEDAFSNFRFASELMPEHSRALYSMGSIYDAGGKTDKAIECLDRSLEGIERLEMAYNLLAEIYISTDNVNLAIKVFEEAIVEHPKSYLLHYNLGISLMMVRRYEESVRIFKKGQKLTDDDPALYYNWASAETSLRNYSEAAKLYKDGLKLKSDDDEILFGLARVSALSGDVDATIGFLTRAFEINPALKLRAKASHDFSAFRTYPEFMKITRLPARQE